MKQIFYVKNARHIDLYDRVDMIPFDKLDSFLSQTLNKIRDEINYFNHHDLHGSHAGIM